MTKCLHLTRITLDDAIRQRRVIAVAWAIDDVQWVRCDLSESQAWKVLQEVERSYDSDQGITWSTLRDAADDLFPQRDVPPDPEGQNDERSSWAGTALATFREQTGADEHDALCDLLCDLMHWADRAPSDFSAALERARFHYDAETGGDQ